MVGTLPVAPVQLPISRSRTYIRFNQLDSSLTASDSTPFRFGVNENGEYGYIITDSEGADSVVPFSKINNIFPDTLTISLNVESTQNSSSYARTSSTSYIPKGIYKFAMLDGGNVCTINDVRITAGELTSIPNTEEELAKIYLQMYFNRESSDSSKHAILTLYKNDPTAAK